MHPTSLIDQLPNVYSHSSLTINHYSIDWQETEMLHATYYIFAACCMILSVVLTNLLLYPDTELIFESSP